MNLDIPNQQSSIFWQSVKALCATRSYPSGTKLFERGTTAKGVYLVEDGAVNLIWDGESKAGPVFEVAAAGAVLGLSESMTGDAHRMTAEVSAPSRVAYVERSAFLALMREHPEFCMQVVRLLSENLHGLYYRVQSIPLGGTRDNTSA